MGRRALCLLLVAVCLHGAACCPFLKRLASRDTEACFTLFVARCK